MKNLAQKALGAEKAKQFKTKALRSFYNSALLRVLDAKSEIKDVMMGHKRLGARGHYAYDEYTMKEAYTKAFEHLTINGTQVREDIKSMKEEFYEKFGKQQEQIEDMKNIIETLQKLLDAKYPELIKYEKQHKQ